MKVKNFWKPNHPQREINLKCTITIGKFMLQSNQSLEYFNFAATNGPRFLLNNYERQISIKKLRNSKNEPNFPNNPGTDREERLKFHFWKCNSLSATEWYLTLWFFRQPSWLRRWLLAIGTGTWWNNWQNSFPKR